MILIDTSVWIRLWLERPGYAAPVEALVHGGEAGGHELVHGELLVGDSGGRSGFLRDYERLRWAERVPHFEVVRLARERRLCGRGLSWVDVHLLASVLACGWRLWTADERLAGLADELGAGWRPRP